MDLCLLPIQVVVLDFLIMLNSDSVSVEYKKTFQSYFGEQVIGSQILSNKPTNMVFDCSEK